MSFIDLMGNDRWTETDIKTRLHSLIRSQISEQVEDEIKRASIGVALGQHTFSQEEYVKLLQFKKLTEEVDAIGHQARADWALLSQVMDIEDKLREGAEVVLPVEGDSTYELYRMRNPV
jgi:hypothetical protein